MARCEWVDPNSNYKCGGTFQITRIVFFDPTKKEPIIKLTCKKHGDLRFNVLSFSEVELKKLIDNGKVDWQDQKDEMKAIRWSRCRRCHEDFKKEDIIWVVEYFSIQNDIQMRMRRSFLLHKDCAERELTLYRYKQTADTIRKLDSFG